MTYAAICIKWITWDSLREMREHMAYYTEASIENTALNSVLICINKINCLINWFNSYNIIMRYKNFTLIIIVACFIWGFWMRVKYFHAHSNIKFRINWNRWHRINILSYLLECMEESLLYTAYWIFNEKSSKLTKIHTNWTFPTQWKSAQDGSRFQGLWLK